MPSATLQEFLERGIKDAEDATDPVEARDKLATVLHVARWALRLRLLPEEEFRRVKAAAASKLNNLPLWALQAREE